jgi:hypothetical protein
MTYSDEIAQKIMDITCAFYGVHPQSAMKNRLHLHTPQTRAKYIATYLIQQMTGAPIKVISMFFGLKPVDSNVGGIARTTERRIESDPIWFADYSKIKKMIVKEFSQKKYESGHHPNSVPKDTSNHPFRKQNKSIPQYSQKALYQKRIA